MRVHRHPQTPLADRLVEALEPARQRLQLLADRAPPTPGASAIGATNSTLPPAAASEPAAARAEASAAAPSPGSKTTGTNAATGLSPWRASVAAQRRRVRRQVADRTELGPASPSDAISASTVSGSRVGPHPGTSHTPQEIGAPTSRAGEADDRRPRGRAHVSASPVSASKK